MSLGIDRIRPGAYTGDIGAVIQAEAEKCGYGIVRDYTGHGVGRKLHSFPPIYHYGEEGTGVELKQGMAITVEPMLNIGSEKTRMLPDKWGAVTIDNSLSAQFEHTILVVEDGFEILTKSNHWKD
jgi:methionyl aminopeptidase